MRLDVVIHGGCLGQRREHVDGGNGAGGGLDAWRFSRDGTAQFLEQLQFALDDPLVGTDHLFLVFLQRRRDVALAARNRLLAVIVGRHRVQIRLGDLDVVAEDAVVADLQVGDAGARALAFLHFGDVLLAASADGAQIVDLGVEAVAREAAVAGEHRWIINQRRLDLVAHIGQVVELGGQRAHQRRLEIGEQRPQAGDERDRLLQPDEVARAGGPHRRLGDESLEVLHPLHRIAEFAPLRRAEREILDRIEPVANGIEGEQRTEKPRAE